MTARLRRPLEPQGCLGRCAPQPVRRYAGLLLLVSLLCGCGGGPRPSAVPEAEGAFQRARAEYESGDYLRAIELLEGFGRAHPGSKYVDDALFLLGKAHQGNREYLLARQDFERLLRDFPRSPFVEEATFEIANSWFMAVRGPALDAEPAEEALRGFRSYQRRYPEGRLRAAAEAGIREVLGVLAEKDYRNGRTYMRLGYSTAARRYFERSLEVWPESRVAGKALAGIARSYEREGDRLAAREAYQRLITHLEGDPSRCDEGPELLRRARQKLTGQPPTEDEEG